VFATLESRSDILKMLHGLTDERKQILQRCQAMTTDQLNDPVYPGTWSVLKNLAHIAWAEEFMLAWILKRPAPLAKEEWPREAELTLPAVTAALDEAHAAVIAFVKGNDEAVLTEKCQYVPRRGEQTVGGLLFHIVEHEVGHRTFVLHKMERLGVK
jgi:uncharacterized damage-inducible protein DinB